MILRYVFVSLCLCNTIFGNGIQTQEDTHNPHSLEEELTLLLKVDCKQINFLKGTTKAQYKNKEAAKQCVVEQNIFKAIINDDIQAYRSSLNDKWNGYFLFYMTQSPRLKITPLMLSVIFNSPHIFEFILTDAQKADSQSKNKSHLSVNQVISQGHMALGTFKLRGKVYNVHGVNALDLAAMYHRYDMFWALLHYGGEYDNPRYLLTNGIVTFGDRYILELMLRFDEDFLHNFGGGHILHFAARDGNIELLEYLIKDKQMPINALRAGETPLDAALNAKNFQHKPQLQAAQKLIELGAKISQANQKRIDKLTKDN